MKLKIIISMTLSFMFACTVFSSCTKETETIPSVKLTEVACTESSLVFFAEVSHATEMYWLCKEGADEQFTIEEVMTDGVKVSAESQKIEVANLKAATAYVIAAVAGNNVDKVLSSTLKMTTLNVQNGLAVSITPGASAETSLSFTVIPSSADRCAYLCVKKSEAKGIPSAEEIFEKGEIVENADEPSFVTVNDLETKTEYMIVAAVEDAENKAVSEPVYMATKEASAGADMKVFIENIIATHNTITFTVIPVNAGAAAYDFEMKTVDYEYRNDAAEIFSRGTKLESVSQPTTITIDDLRDEQTYVLYAAVESESNYDKVMTMAEITTEKRQDPEELPNENMLSGKMITNLRGKQFDLLLENDKYSVKIVMCENMTEPSYMPHITPHEYEYVPEGILDSWTLTNLTSVLDKNTDTYLEIVKGSLTVEYNVPEYTMTGRFITDDDKAFNYTYVGTLPYMIGFDKGKITKTENNTELSLGGKVHGLTLLFGANTIEGEHTVGTTVSKESTLSIDMEGKEQSFKLADGTFSINTDQYGKYNVNGTFSLENGDVVYTEQRGISVEEPSTPDTDEIVFDTAEARGGPYDSGWVTAYDITFKNSEWEFYIAFEEVGDYDKMPTGKFLYSDWGGGEISGYRLKNSSGSITDLDEGYMQVSKDGEIYTIKLEFTRFSGNKIIATYTGPVPCEDMSGM